MTTTDQLPEKPVDMPPGAVMAEDKISLYLPSILGYEKIARRTAEALAEQMDFSPERIEDLKTAVAEACMNAIEHGNSLDRAINVTVVMTITPDKLEVRVADVGKQVVPATLPPPGSGDMRGWGMFLIRNLVDEMEITRLPDGGNQIRMALYLVPPPKEDTEPQASAVQTVSDAPKAVLPIAEKPAALQTIEEKPTAIQRAEDKPAAILPAEDQPKAVLPAEEKPAAPSDHSNHRAPDHTPTPES
jgi:serine/threonine-protein kinase RsbW